jgi:hypothetical protein
VSRCATFVTVFAISATLQPFAYPPIGLKYPGTFSEISWDVFCNILDSSPLIESLCVEKCRFPRDRYTHVRIPGQISLNSLTHLTLENSKTYKILKKLVTPKLVQLVIRLSLGTTTFDGSLMEHLRTLLTLESLSIEVAQPETESRWLTLTVEGITATLTFSRTMLIHCFQFRLLFTHFIPKIKTLTVGVGFQSFKLAAATGLSSSMASVQRLTVVGEQWESILRSLLSEGVRTALVCPELEEITVVLTLDTY